MLNRRAVIFAGGALLAACDSPEKTMTKARGPKRGPSQVVASKDGTRIAFERWGSGPPLVLVDGAFCSRRFGPTDKLAPLLADHFTVFAYDRRGRGLSGDARPPAVEREVEDLAAIMGAAGGASAVFGMSSGGVLALEAAAQGLPIRRLAVYEPPYRTPPVKNPPPIDYAARLQAFIAAGDRAGAVKYYMTQIMLMPAPLVFIMKWTPNWQQLQAAAPSLEYEASLMGDFHLPRDRLARISAPTLVLAGSKGPDMMRRAAVEVATATPGARHKVLEGQSHDVSMPVLAAVLTQFFA